MCPQPSSLRGPGFSGKEHHLAAFRVGADGELSQYGDMVKLRWRPINNSVDRKGEYVLVAYNFPAGVSVHRIKADGSLGDEVAQPDNLEKGGMVVGLWLCGGVAVGSCCLKPTRHGLLPVYCRARQALTSIRLHTKTKRSNEQKRSHS
jgi:hypothetical protein